MALNHPNQGNATRQWKESWRMAKVGNAMLLFLGIVAGMALQTKLLDRYWNFRPNVSFSRLYYLPVPSNGTDFSKKVISTVSEITHSLDATEASGLPFAENFYEILQGKPGNCLPTSRKCVSCLRNRKNEATCNSCGVVCECYCNALCKTKVAEKFVSKTLTVFPPKYAFKPDRLIPRIVHQTYFEAILPGKYPNWSRMVNSFKHSGWEYRFYTDHDAQIFLTEHFPIEVLEAFNALTLGAFRADLFRYCVLLVSGGLYADVDVMLMQTNLDNLIDPQTGFMAPLDEPGKPIGRQMCLWNGFLASAPGHPFLAKAIETAVNQVQNRFTGADIANSFCPQPELSTLHSYDLLFLTGPCLLGSSVNRVLKRHGQHGFAPGEIKMPNDDIGWTEVPGKSIILEQRKKDMGLHTINDMERNLVVAATDIPNADDRANQNTTLIHYSETTKHQPIFGASMVYTNHEMIDEKIRIIVERKRQIQPPAMIRHPKSNIIGNLTFNFPSVEERVKYYMGPWWEPEAADTKKWCAATPFYYKGLEPTSDEPYIFNLKNIDWHPLQNYANDIKKHLLSNAPDPASFNVIVMIGDRSKGAEGIPTIAKSRDLRSRKNIVALLHEKRHFSGVYFAMVQSSTIQWHQKQARIVWRGSSTSHGLRMAVVQKYINSISEGIDIAFTKLVQDDVNDTAAANLLRPSMEPEQLLKYKYLLSIEGNDVASGLKWMLLSNSVVFMAKPTKESWAMEGLLVPYYHYIPLAPDHSDLKAKLKWARNNDDICQRIAIQATQYMDDLCMSPKAKEETIKVHKGIMVRYHELYGKTLSSC